MSCKYYGMKVFYKICIDYCHQLTHKNKRAVDRMSNIIFLVFFFYCCFDLFYLMSVLSSEPTQDQWQR